MRTSNEIRQVYLDFMESKDHRILPGISLVPTDPSIFLTTAGMVPFLAMLEGREPAPYPRVATCQRCCRTGDLEGVGKFARYHTFFEMLGNWSFGDYFKHESISWGWEFVTQVLGLPGERIWATVFGNHPEYPDDDEAFRIWTDEVGVPAERIIKLPDNWWGPVLETGACGPDSEFYYDLGPEFGCGSPDCKPGCECDRYLEFWNHVFTERYKNADGSMGWLQSKNIDTGMGLERLTCVVQNKPSVYDTDLFAPIMDHVDEVVGRATGRAGERNDWRKRVIADHGRAATFLVMDGIYPANVGRGYVLRRILRRAATFGFMLGVKDAFLHELVPVVVEKMASGYPELHEKQTVILEQIRREEDQFARTLDRGVPRFLEQAKDGGIIDGAFAWDVYATSGVPFEVMQELASEHGAAIDEQGYARAREEHSRVSGKGTADKRSVQALGVAPTEFLGYEHTGAEGEILALLHDGDEVDSLEAGEVGAVVLDRTPFYGESGGQVGDTGQLSAGVGGISGTATVLDTERRGGHFAHFVRVEQGRLHPGMRVQAEVDTERRDAIKRAHTATHLLHAALRLVLGTHVVQRGSVVEPDRLRFDFAHGQAMSAEEIARVEEMVNTEVLRDTPVQIDLRSQEEARQLGAMMLFGEKYGEVVRVVQVPGYSMELCGGTHVSRTGAIGLVKITSEGSAAAGVRRLDCTTGLGSLAHVQAQSRSLRDLADALGGSVDQIPERIAAQKEQVAVLRQQLSTTREKLVAATLSGSSAAASQAYREEAVGDLALFTGLEEVADVEMIKSIADRRTEEIKNGVVVIASIIDHKVLFVAKASPQAVSRGAHAGNLVRDVAKRAGGGGGGRPEFGQAAGKDPAKAKEALASAREILAAQVGVPGGT